MRLAARDGSHYKNVTIDLVSRADCQDDGQLCHYYYLVLPSDDNHKLLTRFFSRKSDSRDGVVRPSVSPLVSL